MSEIMIPFAITFQVTAREDFHSGDGLGKVGLYDSGQQAEYDRHGRRRPIIRDDTFSGLLRDSCRQLVETPDYTTEWAGVHPGVDLGDLFTGLFDYRTGDSLLHRSLRPREESIQACAAAGRELLTLSSQTAINTKTKIAQENSLRTWECGVAGLTFGGELRGRVQDRKFEAAKYFLTDGLKNLRRLGGRRRRGFGAVKIENIQVFDLPTLTASPSLAAALPTRPVCLVLVLETLEPVHAGASGQVGNIMASLDYLPGTTLLGACRHEFRLEIAARLDAATRKAVAEMLADNGPVSFGPAYPLSPIDLPAGPVEDLWPRPAPLSWRRFKTPEPAGITGVDLLGLNKDEKPGAPTKRFDDYYVCGNRLYRQGKARMMRNQIDHKTGRVKEPNLFTTEYLPAGTCLAATLRFPSYEACTLFQQAFQPWLQDGRWLGLGQGRKPVQIGAVYPCSPLLTSTGSTPPEKFILALETDTVLLTPALTAGLNLQAYLETLDPPCTYKVERAFVRTQELQPFTPIGGLPGFPLLALGRGSVYEFTSKEDQDPAARQKFWDHLQHQTVTGNLGEGYSYGWGRFWLGQACGDLSQELPDPGQGLEPPPNRREEILAQARDFLACRPELYRDGAPSRSQWGHLLELVESSSAPPQETLTKHEETLQGKKNSTWNKKINTNQTFLQALLAKISEYHSHAEQRLFLEGLVRWLRLQK